MDRVVEKYVEMPVDKVVVNEVPFNIENVTEQVVDVCMYVCI